MQYSSWSLVVVLLASGCSNLERPAKSQRTTEQPAPAASSTKPVAQVETKHTTEGDVRQKADPRSEPKAHQPAHQPDQPADRGGRARETAPRKAKVTSKPKPSRADDAPSESRSTGLVYRAGALRVAARGGGEYRLRYSAQSIPPLKALQRKLGKSRPEASVTPFREEPRGKDPLVKRGAEIVSIAIALELESMGWKVDVLGKELLAKGLRAPAASQLSSSAFQITGTASFTTGESGATLAGTVHFARNEKPVISITKSVTAGPPANVELPSRRRDLAAEAALRTFVASVLGDPGLDAALVGAL